jgi:hypothetical protein
MKTCSTCRFWQGRGREDWEADYSHGRYECKAVPHEAGQDAATCKATARDAEDYSAGLYTTAEFGCVQHEEA